MMTSKSMRQIFTRIDPKVYAALEKAAKAARRSVSAEAALRLEQSLQRENGGKQ